MNAPAGTGNAEGQICGLLAVDIAAFGAPARDDDIQAYLRAALYGMLESAFKSCGVPWRCCAHEDRGDGVLIVIPSAIPVTRVLGLVPGRLSSLLRHHNRLSSSAAHIRLRAAAHIGHVRRDRYGLTGDAVVHLFRLLDAQPLRQLLADSGADMAFAVSGYVFDAIIRRQPAVADPGTFCLMTVEVKETRTLAWATLPGGTPLPDGIPPEIAS
jgi:hypothetical protein